MRVVAGTYKGHRIEAVPNKLTRPTTDKVKEALFQMIGPFFNGGIFLDLFAGSGALGVEAISRGMDKGIFVDQQAKAIQTIHSNSKALKIQEQIEVYRTDAFRALKAASKRELVFDLIFLDPPYKKVSYNKLLKQIYDYKLIHKDTIIVCEHDGREKLSDNVEAFHKIKSDVYGGSTAITLYQLGDECNG
ncbi:Ribosomal RNA small subunit methyltransferase D [Paraliobacillus sp. PM-2]|uniref:16S rRNA (guanine(966)-N(2))-methyltransferase RsmD n=1 Tax=Paraliobacillus sp. PM-2 TaxID=1462524 RepID=UPI00061C4ED5|nr:16S rRNA (guanine(966)-N(2))-methyltransferase RsmD [Paraliobacillus sp. PM-2]CQR47810.1 Ribosomal RNA small subunit methyltransferase D [Paraliobacillus sp. PM-2]